MKKYEDVMKDLEKMIGKTINADDIICAFGNFEDENLEHGVIFEESQNAGYDYIAYVNKEDSTNVCFVVDDNDKIVEIY